MKKIFFISGAILITVIIGLIIPRLISREAESIKIDQGKSLEEVQKQFVEDLRAVQAEQAALAVEDASNTDNSTNKINSELPTNSVNQSSKLNDTNSVVEPNKEDIDFFNHYVISQDTEEIEASEETEAPVELVEPKEPSEQIVKDAWIQEKIDENRDQIDDGELYTGAAIYNQLDTAYLFEFAAGGLTEEEKLQVKAYLEANLLPSEIETAMALYYEYVHLLN